MAKSFMRFDSPQSNRNALRVINHKKQEVAKWLVSLEIFLD